MSKNRIHSLSGKIVHDPRGTAVWDWDIATGVLAISNSGELLQRLDNPTLEIETDLATEWAGTPITAVDRGIRRRNCRHRASSHSLRVAGRQMVN